MFDYLIHLWWMCLCKEITVLGLNELVDQNIISLKKFDSNVAIGLT